MSKISNYPGDVAPLLPHFKLFLGRYIHTAIETCGHIPWKHFEKVIGYLNWIFFDLKHIDPEQHKKGTGSSNATIINNVRKLNETFKGKLVFRLPFIPGYNSSKENLTGIASLISETSWQSVVSSRQSAVGSRQSVGISSITDSNFASLISVKCHQFKEVGYICYSRHTQKLYVMLWSL